MISARADGHRLTEGVRPRGQNDQPSSKIRVLSARLPRFVGYRLRVLSASLIVEDRRTGELAGLEIKLTSTPTARHARHLTMLRDKLANRFTVGLVVHTGTQTLPLGDRIWAVPRLGAVALGPLTHVLRRDRRRSPVPGTHDATRPPFSADVAAPLESRVPGIQGSGSVIALIRPVTDSGISTHGETDSLGRPGRRGRRIPGLRAPALPRSRPSAGAHPAPPACRTTTRCW